MTGIHFKYEELAMVFQMSKHTTVINDYEEAGQ